MPEIHKALMDVMRNIPAIGKDSKNQQQGFQFRGIDTIYNELHDLLADAGIVTLPEVLDVTSEERTNTKGTVLRFTIVKIRYHFTASDGSSVACTMCGEGMDSGDKSCAKAASIAHKYALLQAFLIPTGDSKDPDAESHEVQPRTQRNQQPANTDL